jgi:Kef-type K+ transport system membrane component KefB
MVSRGEVGLIANGNLTATLSAIDHGLFIPPFFVAMGLSSNFPVEGKEPADDCDEEDDASGLLFAQILSVVGNWCGAAFLPL